MNEQIRALAEQANEAFYQRMGEGAERGTFYFDGFAEKFAELIVLECEKVAKDPQWYSKSPSNSWRNPINHVCSVLKEHFGVES